MIQWVLIKVPEYRYVCCYKIYISFPFIFLEFEVSSTLLRQYKWKYSQKMILWYYGQQNITGKNCCGDMIKHTRSKCHLRDIYGVDTWLTLWLSKCENSAPPATPTLPFSAKFKNSVFVRNHEMELQMCAQVSWLKRGEKAFLYF